MIEQRVDKTSAGCKAQGGASYPPVFDKKGACTPLETAPVNYKLKIDYGFCRSKFSYWIPGFMVAGSFSNEKLNNLLNFILYET